MVGQTCIWHILALQFGASHAATAGLLHVPHVSFMAACSSRLDDESTCHRIIRTGQPSKLSTRHRNTEQPARNLATALRRDLCP